ncbi:MAG: bifunctional riboflavin kinase/FAD synthetase [Eubacteriales bacterium]
MHIIKGTTRFQLEQNTAVVIGKFDGMHIGHQALFEEIKKYKECGLATAVFTFDPPPEVLFGQRSLQELMTGEEKRHYFEEIGIDFLIEYPLNFETAAILPEEFIERILVNQMKMKHIAAGSDLSFGHKGLGNCELLEKFTETFKYTVKIIDKVSIGDTIVSSSLVRNKVDMGEMEQVTRLLGRPYEIMGIVQHGKKLGRTMGMPTANVLPANNKLLPPNGVYYSRVKVGNKEYKGITNIGINPTVEEKIQKSVETYLYDFDGDLYHQTIFIELLSFKRKEQKFHSLEELSVQIKRDMEEGRQKKFQLTNLM